MSCQRSDPFSSIFGPRLLPSLLFILSVNVHVLQVIQTQTGQSNNLSDICLSFSLYCPFPVTIRIQLSHSPYRLSYCLP